MSFRLAMPSGDLKALREDDLSLAKTMSTRNMRSGQTDGTATPASSRLDYPAEAVASPAPNRRHVVIPDPVAFRWLEADASITVVERRAVLRGYELYLVEQWACARQFPTMVIITYTGDEKNSVVAGVLSLPADESTWSPRLEQYFKAVQQYHARPKGTPLGELMVTNLSSFSSALTVISVPDGDIKQHRQIFIVNEDLKRLGCSGRSGMTLSEPSAASKGKFYQLYKVNEKIPFSEAVVELVKMCQAALFIFGVLGQEYIDGLLCDNTESAIGDWWTEFGADHYNIEPTDGILGPTTVAALLGLLIGARNRLSYLSAPVSKDVFDIEVTRRGIGYFQKMQKMDRTKILDRQTLYKLHAATAKAAAGEGWGVQKAVKSTVTEIGGKRGELVIGMVGGRDKGAIGDIETLDLDRFLTMLHGERAKWLWQGKPKRSTLEHHDSVGNMLFGKEDPTTQQRKASTMPLDEEIEPKKKDDSPGVYSAPPPGSATSFADSPGEKEGLRRGVLKGVAGARQGLGRIKDAVVSGGGLRGHAAKPSRDDTPETAYTSSSVRSHIRDGSAGLLASPGASVGRAFTWKVKPEEYLSTIKSESDIHETAPLSENALDRVESTPLDVKLTASAASEPDNSALGDSHLLADIRKDMVSNEPSVAGSVVDEKELQGPILETQREYGSTLAHLRRRHSVGTLLPAKHSIPNENRWPRRLSFSDAETAVLGWKDIVALPVDAAEDTGAMDDDQRPLIEYAQSLFLSVLDVEQNLDPWVHSKLKAIKAIDDHFGRQQEQLQTLYYHLSDAYQRVKHNSQDMIADERAQITEAVKDVEVQAAKLEYEINALISRVQDVDDGVVQFERQVEAVEKRVEELKIQLETESWLHWFVRTLTGIGTGPNITKPRST